jgi:hypothetical protein
MALALRRIVPRPLRVQASAVLARRRRGRLEQDLAALAAGTEPIVAGPWLGEVGFELLYWVPFLAWFAERFAVAPERLLVVSRGGTASWYARFAKHYSDVFEVVGPEQFREAHDQRVRELGEQKQTRVTAFDRELIERSTARAGVWQWQSLHPQRMYDALNPFWWGHLPLEWVHEHTRYTTLTRAALEGIPALPDDFVAVKFYFNECFPATAANRHFAARTIEAVASRRPVVVLSTGLRLDDHAEERVAIAQDGRVIYLPEGIDPARNLEVQSAVVARARAVVGTYGGFAYLPPFFGVPSHGCYSDAAGFSTRHLDVARSAFGHIGAAGLMQVRQASEGTTAEIVEALG